MLGGVNLAGFQCHLLSGQYWLSMVKPANFLPCQSVGCHYQDSVDGQGSFVFIVFNTSNLEFKLVKN